MVLKFIILIVFVASLCVIAQGILIIHKIHIFYSKYHVAPKSSHQTAAEFAIAEVIRQSGHSPRMAYEAEINERGAVCQAYGTCFNNIAVDVAGENMIGYCGFPRSAIIWLYDCYLRIQNATEIPVIRPST